MIFEMSPEYKLKPMTKIDQQVMILDSTRQRQAKNGQGQPPIKNNEAMDIRSVNADLQGYNLLDLGHAQIASLQLHIADSSAIILSGSALKKLH